MYGNVFSACIGPGLGVLSREVYVRRMNGNIGGISFLMTQQFSMPPKRVQQQCFSSQCLKDDGFQRVVAVGTVIKSGIHHARTTQKSRGVQGFSRLDFLYNRPKPMRVV